MKPLINARPARRAPLPQWHVGAGAPLPSGPFIALVPGAEAPLIALSLPAALRGVAREDVAHRQALDRLGLAAGAVDIRPARLDQGDGWSHVAVAARASVLRWRAALGAGAGRCRGLVPDYLALPSAPGLWTLAHDGDMIRARLGPQDGFSAEPALAEAMLARALQQAGASHTLPRAVLWTGPRVAAIEALLAGVRLVDKAADLPEALRPQRFAPGAVALDFSRDPRADAAAIEARLRRALWPVLLVALGAAGWTGAALLELRHDRVTSADILAQTEAAARRDLLGAVPLLDLRVQVTREIERRRGADTVPDVPVRPFDLLRHASTILADAPARVQAVALGEAVEGVMLDLSLRDFRALDAVQAALLAAGLGVSVTRSGIDPEGGVAASLTVSGGAR